MNRKYNPKAKKRDRGLNAVILIGILIIIIAGFYSYFLNSNLTGKAIFEDTVSSTYQIGDKLNGSLVIIIENIDLIQKDILININLNKDNNILTNYSLTFESFLSIYSITPVEIFNEGLNSSDDYFNQTGSYSRDIRDFIDYTFNETGNYSLKINVSTLSLSYEKNIIVENIIENQTNETSGKEFGILSTPGATNVTNCMTLSTANTYYQLNQSISNNTITTDCIIISAQNITFDCNGYSISSTKNYTGVYSNQLNTTVKNCNITMGGNVGANTNAIGIEFISGANNGLIYNNNATANVGYGIYLISNSNNNLTGNNGTSNSNYGIRLYYSLNNTLTNNIGFSNSKTGIMVESSSNNTLTNNTGTSTLEYGIYLVSDSVNNNLTGNTGISTSSSGIYIWSSSNNTLTNNRGISNSGSGFDIMTSSNNTLTGNNGTSYSNGYGAGILLRSASNILINNYFYAKGGNYGGIIISSQKNNILINNTGISNSSYGIYLSSASNNTLTNNTGTSTSSAGIYLSSSSNNTLTSNTGTSNSSYALYINLSSKNNIILRQNATGYSTGSYGIYLNTNSDNNIIQDCVNVSGIAGDIFLTGNSINNTFINCSYRTTGTNESVAAGSSLIRKWYYRANVTNLSGDSLNLVNITLFNNTGDYNFNLTTGATGFTQRGEIIDYINNGGTRNYYSLYSSTASLTGYDTETHSFNSSLENNLSDLFILHVPVVPIETPVISSPGGGSTPQTFSLNETLTRPGLGEIPGQRAEQTEGISFGLAVNDKISFSIHTPDNTGDAGSASYTYQTNNVNYTHHRLTLKQFNSKTAKVKIESESIIVVLEKGILYEFDVNNDSINDIRVRYDGINSTTRRAMIFMQEIIYATPAENITENPEAEKVKSTQDNNYLIIAIIIVIVLIIVIAIVLFFVLKRQKKRKKYKRYGKKNIFEQGFKPLLTSPSTPGLKHKTQPQT